MAEDKKAEETKGQMNPALREIFGAFSQRINGQQRPVSFDGDLWQRMDS
jgi:hypothetical protein